MDEERRWVFDNTVRAGQEQAAAIDRLLSDGFQERQRVLDVVGVSLAEAGVV